PSSFDHGTTRAGASTHEQKPVPARAPSIPGGWNKPRPEKTPHPTYAPATLGLGVVCMLWGLVTTPLISLVGAILFGIALAVWIGDLRHER
ncbi:MAG: hypothetical protein ACRD10_03560, partial [Terriglobia bacterium]